MNQIDLSVIIVTWNSEKWIKKCLDSVLAESDKLKLETIVVDNFSQDKTLETLKTYGAKIMLIQNSLNLGYAKGCNQGLKIASGNYILLLNPDTKVMDHSLEKMVLFLQQNLQVGAVGPQLLDFEGKIQPSCRRFPNYKFLLWEFSGLSRLFPKSKHFGGWRMGDFDFQSTREVDQPMGSALLVRKKVIQQVGLMDKRFSMFYNDVDLCKKIQQAGWKIYFNPEAKIYHFKGASTGQVKIKMVFLTHWGSFLYLKKYESCGFKKFFLFPFGLGLFLSAIIRGMYHFFRRLAMIIKGT